MTDQIQDQVSAFIDDELSAEECAFLVRRLERDPAARAKAIRYATIGATLRGELLEPDPGVLLRRVQQELAGGTQHPRGPTRRQGRTVRIAKPALGIGIAATVAAVGLLALKNFNQPAGQLGEARFAAGAVQAREWSEPPSYVVPQERPAEQRVLPPIRLTNYLVHHGEYASRLGRTSVHSNVVAAEARAEPEDGRSPE